MPPVAELLEAPPAADTAEDRNVHVERVNFVQTGKRFKCWFMTPGVVNYEDSPTMPGQELIKKPAIDENLETLIGCPLTIGHVPTNLSAEELVDHANGRIDKAYFDADRGWFCCEGTIETEQALRAIENGWGVSVGTRLKKSDFDGPGHWLNNAYDREIRKLRFHHLALCEPGLQPRFEDAEITRTNSINRPIMHKLIKRIVDKVTGKVTESVTEIPAGARIDVGGGKTAPLEEIVRDNHCYAIEGDDMFEYGGVRYHAGSMVKAYTERANAGHHVSRMNSEEEAKKIEEEKKKAEMDRLNAEEMETKKKMEEDAEAERQNAIKLKADADAKAKADAEELERQNAVKAKADKEKADADAKAKSEADELERQNAARRNGAESFATLGTARDNRAQAPVPAVSMSGTRAARLARGRKFFGSDN